MVIIFSFKIIHLSLSQKKISGFSNQNSKFTLLRRDIVDRNGVIISRNVSTYHAGVDPKLVNDKKNFLIKLRIIFPDLSPVEIRKKLDGKKYFRIKTRIDQNEKQKLWSLGEKAINLNLFKQECILMVIFSVMLSGKLIMIIMEFQE